MAKRPAINIGAMRFTARFVKRPDGYDSRGQQEQTDEEIIVGVPCSVTPLGGRELESARQRVATADLRLECCGPLAAINSANVAILNDGRRLTIGYIEDVFQDGRLLRMACSVEA